VGDVLARDRRSPSCAGRWRSGRPCGTTVWAGGVFAGGSGLAPAASGSAGACPSRPRGLGVLAAELRVGKQAGSRKQQSGRHLPARRPRSRLAAKPGARRGLTGRLLAPNLSCPVWRTGVGDRTIAFPERSRADGPRADDRYGDEGASRRARGGALADERFRSASAHWPTPRPRRRARDRMTPSRPSTGISTSTRGCRCPTSGSTDPGAAAAGIVRLVVLVLEPSSWRRRRSYDSAARSRYVRFDDGHPSPSPNRTWGLPGA
jgi:hypothetical protein